MNNDEYYDDDAAFEAMQEDFYDADIQDEYCENDIFTDEYGNIFTAVSTKKLTLEEAALEMMINESAELYGHFLCIVQSKPFLLLSLGIEKGLPYYQTEIYNRQVKIFITKEIYHQIHNYLKDGVIPNKMPNVYDVYRNMDENFILRHFKADTANKVTTYSETTKEYKAKYPNGIINYGQLPYTKDELKAKINS